jgi:hypothetical protein
MQMAPSNLCEFFTGGTCALGYHGGRPLPGNCRACQSAGENTREAAAAHQVCLAASPGLLRRVTTFTAASCRESAAIARGIPAVTAEQRAARLARCMAPCPHLRTDNDTCRLCGCYVHHKTKWRTQSCPAGHWT